MPLGSGAATVAVLAFLHAPFALIVLCAFDVEARALAFPPAGLTTMWFATTWASAVG